MKRLFWVSLAAFAMMMMATGCLDDTESPVQYLELGRVGELQTDVPVVITDSELILRIEEYSGDFDFENSQRVLLKYEVIGEDSDNKSEGITDTYDYAVKALSVREVVTKDIVELNEENRDTIGTDPIFLNDIWLGGGYLNLEFTFYGNDKTHYINVVKDPAQQSADPAEVHLQVRHDARDDDMNQRYRGLMSFHLDSVEVDNLNEVKLIFEEQAFYASPFSGFEIDYSY